MIRQEKEVREEIDHLLYIAPRDKDEEVNDIDG